MVPYRIKVKEGVVTTFWNKDLQKELVEYGKIFDFASWNDYVRYKEGKIFKVNRLCGKGVWRINDDKFSRWELICNEPLLDELFQWSE